MRRSERAASRWVIVTIRRAARAARRRLMREQAERPTDPASPIFQEAEAAGDAEDLYVNELLDQLTSLERRVIVLSVLDGVPQARIASLLGISQSQVSRLRTGALTRLKKLMEEGELRGKAPGR